MSPASSASLAAMFLMAVSAQAMWNTECALANRWVRRACVSTRSGQILGYNVLRQENLCAMLCRVRESWKDVDSRYRVRTRLRHTKDDIQRMLPHWRRRFREFAQSRTGRITLWAGLIYSIVSGLLFRVGSHPTARCALHCHRLRTDMNMAK
jgi:hypothetical protein